MKKFGNILLMAAGLLLLFTAGGEHPHLLSLRQEYHLNQAEPLENAPPLVAFTTVALGGFRGLLADLLWIRASCLQEEGQYFELVQLSDWITKLEPRFATVWAFQAWNMAYNISVLFQNPEDRWRWVRHGITLLRDDGLRYNPGDARLHRELGWLFQHKLAMDFDQAHAYYKQAWAQEMMGLFGTAHPDFEQLPPEVAARALREFRLDPAALAKVDRQYGPLDWRMPQAHALYWAFQGLPYAKGFERVALDRMIVQSLADAVREGRWVDHFEGGFHTEPDFALLPKAIQAYQEVIRRHPDMETFQTAYQNFLRSAVLLLYVSRQESDATQLMKTLQQEFPEAVPAGTTLEPFIVSALIGAPDQLPLPDALKAIEDVLHSGAKCRAAGDTTRAEGYERAARLCWQYLGRQHPLPPFEQFHAP